MFFRTIFPILYIISRSSANEDRLLPHVPSHLFATRERKAHRSNLIGVPRQQRHHQSDIISPSQLLSQTEISNNEEKITTRKKQQISTISILRGGGGGLHLKIPPMNQKQGMLTFGQNLAAQSFSFSLCLYGVSCSILPRGTASILYGVNFDPVIPGEGKKITQERHKRVLFLMRLIGATTCGLGLMAAFAISSDLKTVAGDETTLPLATFFNHAIGFGIIPRLIFVAYAALITGKKGDNGPAPKSLRLAGRTDLYISLMESSIYAYALFCDRHHFVLSSIASSLVVFESIISLFLGHLIFFRPIIFFKRFPSASKHEKLLVRLNAAYTASAGVLLACLRHPGMKALPAVGFTALMLMAAILHLTVVRGDIKECGCSVLGHAAMILCGAGIAVGALRDCFLLE